MKISGKVFRGEREGSKIGFPTANIRAENNMEPGIYAGYSTLDESAIVATKIKNLKSLFYISKSDNSLIECHILDFPKRDLYDSEISVEILYKLRDVQEFASLKAASEQIKKDELEARKWFKDNPDKTGIDIIKE